MTAQSEGHGMLRTAARAALLGLAVAALGACASIPQRAWANGQAMTASRAYGSVMSGNMSIESHRALMGSLNPRLLNFRDTPYAPFGQWWY